MKRKILLLFFVVACTGCTYKGTPLRTYLDEPQTIIKDPQFTEYKDQRDELERQYLHKQITYAEYVQRKQELDDQYDREVQMRDQIIMPE